MVSTLVAILQKSCGQEETFYDENSYFLEGKPIKLLLKFSIPCIASLLISALYNIVDQVFIGNSNVGAIGNTATSIVHPIICIALAFGLMLGAETASFISIATGKKESNKVGKAVEIAFSAFFLILELNKMKKMEKNGAPLLLPKTEWIY